MPLEQNLLYTQIRHLSLDDFCKFKKSVCDVVTSIRNVIDFQLGLQVEKEYDIIKYQTNHQTNHQDKNRIKDKCVLFSGRQFVG